MSQPGTRRRKGLIRHITPSLGWRPISDELLVNFLVRILARTLQGERMVAHRPHHTGYDVRVGWDHLHIGDMHWHVELVLDLIKVLHQFEHLDLGLMDDWA